MRTVAIIQARMGSSRLPGKVLQTIGGKPMLAWVLERACRAKTLDEVVLATTDHPSDDPVAAFCAAQGYTYTRGSQFDVLDRYYQAAKQHSADIVVRVTGDCPFVDPVLIDQTVTHLLTEKLDFAANRLPPPWGRTYPIGLDVEVVTMAKLETAWRMTTEKHHREHVMPFFYEDADPDDLQAHPNSTQSGFTITPKNYRVGLLHHTPDHGHMRWTVDTPEDLELARTIATHFPDDTFPWQDVVALFEQYPKLANVNAHIQHRTAQDVDERTR